MILQSFMRQKRAEFYRNMAWSLLGGVALAQAMFYAKHGALFTGSTMLAVAAMQGLALAATIGVSLLA